MGVGRRLYNSPGETMKVIIQDQSGAQIEHRICKTKDRTETIRLGKWLYEKYGIVLWEPDTPKDGKWLDTDSSFLSLKE